MDEIRALINDAKETSSIMHSKLEGKLHLKSDYAMMQTFQNTVNEKVLNLLVSKIDKDEHKRYQNSMRKKITHLEKEVDGKFKPFSSLTIYYRSTPEGHNEWRLQITICGDKQQVLLPFNQ